MTFKAKLRRIGNSMGVITPKEVITAYKEGDVITLEVITEPVITEDKQQVITPIITPIITPTFPTPTFPTSRLVFNQKRGIYERI